MDVATQHALIERIAAHRAAGRRTDVADSDGHRDPCVTVTARVEDAIQCVDRVAAGRTTRPHTARSWWSGRPPMTSPDRAVT